jgi:hypothetical protein
MPSFIPVDYDPFASAGTPKQKPSALEFLHGTRKSPTDIGAPIDTSRPLLKNNDGSYSTERTITITTADTTGRERFINIPTIVNGQQLSEEQASTLYFQGKNPAVGEFDTMDQALASAKARTQAIGETRGVNQPQLQPVEYDPFAASGKFEVKKQPRLQPVDYDPFAGADTAAEPERLSVTIPTPPLIPQDLTLEPPPPVSPETAPRDAGILPDFLPRPAMPEALQQLLNPKPQPRLPEAVLKDIQQRNYSLSPDEYQLIVRALEAGNIKDPQQARLALAGLLTPAGLQVVDEAILTRKLLNEEKPAESILPQEGAGRSFLDGFFKGLTLNVLKPTPDVAPTGVSQIDQMLKAGKQAQDIRRRENLKEHPIAGYGGEVTGSILPFASSVKLLRGLRAARGLIPVEATKAGIIKEGAIAGGPLEFLRRPEGAENMTAEQEFKARAVQAGIGIAAGAVMDFAFLTASQYISRVARQLHDKRTGEALRMEAKAKGFDSPEAYLDSMVDLVDTPDGVIVRPKAEVLDALPREGTAATSPDIGTMETSALDNISGEVRARQLEPDIPNELASIRATHEPELISSTDFKIRTPKGPKDYTPTDTPDTGAQVFLPPGAGQAEHQAVTQYFGRRIKHVETGTFPSALHVVQDANDVAHVAAPLRKDAQESLIAIAADDNGNVLRIARVHRGDQGQAPVDPTLIAGSITNTPGATKAWIVHNHPGGSLLQSEPDAILSGKMAELLRGSGVEYQGSVVVAPGGKAHSVIDPGGQILEGPTTAAPRRQGLPVTERRLTGRPTQTEPIDTPEAAHNALTTHAPDQEGVMILDSDNRPLAFVAMSADEMRNLRTGEQGGSRKLLNALDETGGDGLLVRTDSEAAAGNIHGFAQQTGRRMVDAIDSKGNSFEAANKLPSQSTFYSNPFYVSAREIARDIGLHPGRNIAAGFAGGTYSATTSEEEPGSAKWWLDVAKGAGIGITVAQAARATKLVGKGSILDNFRVRAGNWIDSLPLIGRGPQQLRELKRKQQLMQQIIDRQTEKVGEQLATRFTPSERAMMADLIETRGIVKDFNIIHSQAEALDEYLTHAGETMKKLGMLSEELETGGYLHRYYAKHLGLDKLFREAKGQSLSGSYSISRGTNDTFNRNYFSPGTRKVVDEFEDIARRIDDLDSIKARTPKEAAALERFKARRRELIKHDFVEYVGEQNGEVRSFFFAKDEVAHIPKEVPAIPGQDLIQIERPGEALGIPGTKGLAQTDRNWSLRGVKDDGVLLHRDWTKAERQAWGEIQDAGYRYVRGMAEVSHDLSLATLFSDVSRNADWASDVARSTPKGKAWVRVPTSKVNKNSPLQKYGALAGKYVRPDIWNGISGYGRAVIGDGPTIPFTGVSIGQIYRGALSKWKLYKTVYNPVTHLNNTYSNVEMMYMGGYSPHHLAKGLREMASNEDSALWREARDHGLFGKDWSSSILRTNEGGGNRILDELAEKLRTQPEIPDAAYTTNLIMQVKDWWINSKNAVAGADTKLKSGAELARAMAAPAMKGVKFTLKPIGAAVRSAQRLYRFEDEVFKMSVYAAERAKGASPTQAVNAAQGLFFDYNDLPQGLKIVRDFPIGSPFISYTYFATQVIARNIVQHPERVLALVAGYEAWNYAALASQGMEPGEYWAVEQAEEEVSPPWEKGRALWGGKNTIHIPYMESYRIALGRAHALGNPFMSEAGGREKLPTVPYLTNFWGSSLFGGNPTHALLDIAVNEDWKGKEIYKKGAPTEEKIKKAAAYLYQAWAPSNPLTPGGYSQSKILEGLANDVRKAREAGEDPGIIAPVVDSANKIAETLGMEGFTGLDRMDNEIVTRDAVLGSFGVKMRPIRFEQTEDFAISDANKEQRDLNAWFREKVRLNAEGRITDKQLDAFEQQYIQRSEDIDKKVEKKTTAGEFLRKR